jgi:hypothetical protein
MTSVDSLIDTMETQMSDDVAIHTLKLGKDRKRKAVKETKEGEPSENKVEVSVSEGESEKKKTPVKNKKTPEKNEEKPKNKKTPEKEKSEEKPKKEKSPLKKKVVEVEEEEEVKEEKKPKKEKIVEKEEKKVKKTEKKEEKKKPEKKKSSEKSESEDESDGEEKEDKPEKKKKQKKKTPFEMLKDFLTEFGQKVKDADDIETVLENNEDDYKKFIKKLSTAMVKKVGKKKKDPNAPKGVRNAFILFNKDYREKMKKKNPDLKSTELLTKLGEKWREEKAKNSDIYKKYEKLSAKDKIRHKEEMDDYEPPEEFKKAGKKSPKAKTAYILWCAANRAKIQEENFGDEKGNKVFGEMSKLLGDKWKEIKEEKGKEYKKYVKLAEEEKEKFKENEKSEKKEKKKSVKKDNKKKKVEKDESEDEAEDEAEDEE